MAIGYQTTFNEIQSVLFTLNTSVLVLRRLDLVYYMPDCDSSVFSIDAAFL